MDAQDGKDKAKRQDEIQKFMNESDDKYWMLQKVTIIDAFK